MQPLSYTATRTRTTRLQPETHDPTETTMDELREELRHHDNMAFWQFVITLGTVVAAWLFR